MDQDPVWQCCSSSQCIFALGWVRMVTFDSSLYMCVLFFCECGQDLGCLGPAMTCPPSPAAGGIPPSADITTVVQGSPLPREPGVQDPQRTMRSRQEVPLACTPSGTSCLPISKQCRRLEMSPPQDPQLIAC